MQININIPIEWREYILKRLQETNKYTNELELLESLKEIADTAIAHQLLDM